MVEPFGTAAFNAELNTPVGPVQTQFGYHVIEVYDRKEAGQQTLDEVKPQLEQDLASEKFSTEIQALRDASGVETFPEAAGLSPEQTDGSDQSGGAQVSDTGGSAQNGETGGSAQAGETGGTSGNRWRGRNRRCVGRTIKKYETGRSLARLLPVFIFRTQAQKSSWSKLALLLVTFGAAKLKPLLRSLLPELGEF